MQIHTIHKIEDLSSADIDILTQMLSISQTPPTISWLADQSHFITTRFPAHLLRPTISSAPLARFALHLPFTAPCAILCHDHKPLNPQLIRRIFLQVTAEATMRVRRFQSTQDKCLPPPVQEFLTSIQELNALWMSRRAFRSIYDTRSRFFRIDGGCEACILAAIGGDVRALIDLRSSVIGRKKKGRESHRQPRIASIVEGWIDWSGEGERIREASQELGSEIRRVRKEMQRYRREAREERKNGGKRAISAPVAFTAPDLALFPTPAVEDVEDQEEDFGEGEEGGEVEADFEGSIISFYRNIMSTTNLLDRSTSNLEHSDEIIHPAFRNSVVFIPETGTFQRRSSPPPLIPKRDTFYSQSAYSRDSEIGGHPPRNTERKGPLERHSKTYRDLVGIPEYSDF